VAESLVLVTVDTAFDTEAVFEVVGIVVVVLGVVVTGVTVVVTDGVFFSCASYVERDNGPNVPVAGYIPMAVCHFFTASLVFSWKRLVSLPGDPGPELAIK
jgi:hypothetical protein